MEASRSKTTMGIPERWSERARRSEEMPAPEMRMGFWALADDVMAVAMLRRGDDGRRRDMEIEVSF